MPRTETKDEGIHITREIPLWAVMATLGGLALNGITLYVGFDKWADATRDNTVEIKKLAGQLVVSSNKDAEHDMRMIAIEREMRINESRILALERKLYP